MRIALLGIGHESNTFSSVQANYARFESGGILRGEEIIQKHRDSLDTIAGFLEAAEIYNVDMVPILYTWAEPLGTITKDAFERIVGEMLQSHLSSDQVVPNLVLHKCPFSRSEFVASAGKRIVACQWS